MPEGKYQISDIRIEATAGASLIPIRFSFYQSLSEDSFRREYCEKNCASFPEAEDYLMEECEKRGVDISKAWGQINTEVNDATKS